MIGLSPGLAQGCFELLGLASRSALTFPQLQGSFPHLGGLPASRVIEVSQSLKWLRSDEKGIAAITPTGLRLLAISGYERMLRQAILDYIEVERPPWVHNAPFGRSRVLSFARSEIVQVFVEADLARGVDDDVVAFWDALAARARGQDCERLTAIGRQGERLTIAYEEARTKSSPKWVAIDSNADDYDVLSIVAERDARSLSVEVKASTMGIAGSFHLTRNEWDRSTEVDNHAFHLWAIGPGSTPLLAVVTPTEMDAHIARDVGLGVWESVEVPFAAFKARFHVAAT